MGHSSISAEKRMFSIPKREASPPVGALSTISGIAEQVTVVGSLVNSIAQIHLALTNHIPYEKFIHSTMAILKAADSEVSKSYDYWNITFGIGAKLNLPRGRSLYLTSNELMEAGKYRVIKRNSHNVIMPMKKIHPPKSLDLNMLKNIILTFCKPSFRIRINSVFKKTVDTQTTQLNTTYRGLFGEHTRKTIVDSQLTYHIPGLMKSCLFRSWIERTISASRLDQLQIGENIKNNPEELRFFLDGNLSRIAKETFSAMSKTAVYKALWSAPNECLDYITELLKGVKFYGPSPQFDEEIKNLMILFGIRRWMICMVRSFISRKKSMDRYKRKYEELIESAERNGVPIFRLQEHYFGEFT